MIVAMSTTPRHRAVMMFRVAHSLRTRGRKTLARLIQQRIFHDSGAEIHSAAHIGGGFQLVHSSGIVIGERVNIGENVRCHQNVTIGDKNGNDGQPRIGSEVIIGAGAAILGPIQIGDNVVVGANAVVIDGVADGQTVVGIPARSIVGKNPIAASN